MAGTASLATIGALVGAGVGAVGTGFAVKQGMDAQGQQQDALKRQTTAQQQAQSAALSTQRQSAIAQGAANQITPDVTSILKRAATVGTGASSTMLTGTGGVNPGTLNLGKSTLLGG